MELISYLWYYLIQAFGVIIAYVFAAILIFLILRRVHSRKVTIALVAIFIGASIVFYAPRGLPREFAYPLTLRAFGPGEAPNIKLKSLYRFFMNFNNFERVDNISRDPNEVPPTVVYGKDGMIEVNLTTKEVLAEMANGTTLNYWTFDGTVPGPFIRGRVGDTVHLSIHNDETNLHPHNIDLHAVTGPGGGASATLVSPGQTKEMTFKLLTPGIYVYHCAFGNPGVHMTQGMYGLILVEPEGGLPPVDKEFYIMQGEFYAVGNLGRKGLQLFDSYAYLEGKPQYVVFNGKTGALLNNMSAEVGDTVRFYVGNAGVNLTSNFHVIGEIIDRVYREGDLISPPAQGVQTTLIPAGGAAMLELTLDYPGNYVLLDHALARTDRGAFGVLHVTGKADPDIYNGIITPGGGH
ncbi:MAG: nitrite reductase, copper-containing [Anaerolineaceae bacterium]|nr:MAG: nitrite reductase, copper-containing [Anaerolineaceae bacterium]